jgi:hypothetical protein
MVQWIFDELPARFVEQELTQRDQFNNDEVKLAEAISREAIQNSTDAPDGSGQPVRVRFSVHNVPAADSQKFRNIFAGLKPHLEACGISAALVEQNPIRLLVIEDFNTRGLTGDTGGLDGGNFHSFWRRHGKSGKGGKQGGRWGLGKLVYSSSSEIRSFFGLTVRDGETQPFLMGQAVLSNHMKDGKRHVAHGFWFTDRGDDDIQLPVTDSAFIADFAAMAGITRRGQSGLSIVIPFLHADITEDVLLGGVVGNYYFPILSGKLVVEVGSTVIDRASVLDIANRVLAGASVDPAQFEFIGTVSERLSKQEPPHFTAAAQTGAQQFTAKLFDEAAVTAMKQAYGKGQLLHVRLPVKLRRKTGEERMSHVDLFLRSPPENAKPFVLFARGSITVPAEARYFGGANAYGAFVGSEEQIVAFLGDAENPAHTAWIGTAEKLEANWRSPGPVLKFLRYALVDLYNIVSDQGDREDRDALLDFFSLVDLAQSPGSKAKRTKKTVPEIKPSEKAFRIRKHGAGGFAIVPGPGAATWQYPKAVRVRVAYDILGSNPFSKHSPFDFNLGEEPIRIEKDNISYKVAKSNVLVLTVSSPDFRLEATGFDPNRDLVVDAKAQP